MLSYQRMLCLAAAAVVIGAAAPGLTWADDSQPEVRREFRTQSGGVIRIVGPDGEVRVRRFGTFAQPNPDELTKKLEELQAVAGDRAAVERITRELLESMRQQPQLNNEGLPVGELVALPKFGIGVSLAQEVSASLRKQLNLDDDGGVLIQSVAEESPAAKAGLQEHDVILTVDGKPINLAASLVDAVQAAGEGQKPISLTVVSGGEHKTIEVTPTMTTEIAWGSEDFDADGQLDDLIFNGVNGFTPLFNLNVPPAVMWPDAAGRANGFIVRPLHGDQARLQERIEKLEDQLRELNAKIEELADKK